MTPQQFVEYVASDRIELSHDKIKWQRDDFIKQAKQIVKEQYEKEPKTERVVEDDF